jgi:hypothetical protein
MRGTIKLITFGVPAVVAIYYLTAGSDRPKETSAVEDSKLAPPQIEQVVSEPQGQARTPSSEAPYVVRSQSDDEAQIVRLKKEQELILSMAASLEQNPAMILDPLATYFEKHDFIRDFPEYSKKLEDLAQLAVHSHNPKAVELFFQQAKMTAEYTQPLYEQVLLKRKPGVIVTQEEDIKLSAILHWQDCVTSIENYQQRLVENTNTMPEAPTSHQTNNNN